MFRLLPASRRIRTQGPQGQRFIFPASEGATSAPEVQIRRSCRFPLQHPLTACAPWDRTEVSLVFVASPVVLSVIC
jgi:hypothetical protein